MRRRQVWNARDRALITAATGAGADAAAAYRAFTQQGLDELAADQLWLLPLVWHNRDAARLSPEDAEAMRDRYLEAALWTRPTLEAGLAAMRELEAAGIETMALKGAAALARFDGHIGLRPMADVDVLVPRHQARPALDTLMAQGWWPAAARREVIGVTHAIDLVRGWRERLDLHWSATNTPGDDATIWARSQRTVLAGQPVRIPSPAAQLLITCVHASLNGPGRLTWAADALLILSGSPPVDWDELIAEARRRRVAVPLRSALRALIAELGAEIPRRVVRDLDAYTPGVTERLAYRVALKPGRGAPQLVELYRFQRLVAIDDPDRAPTLLGHLARRWGFRSTPAFLTACFVRAVETARHGYAQSWYDHARLPDRSLPDALRDALKSRPA